MHARAPWVRVEQRDRRRHLVWHRRDQSNPPTSPVVSVTRYIPRLCNLGCDPVSLRLPSHTGPHPTHHPQLKRTRDPDTCQHACCNEGGA